MIKSINNSNKNIKNERMLNFYKNYEKVVTPKIEEYEKLRKQSLKEFFISLLVIFVIIGLLETVIHITFLEALKELGIVGLIFKLIIYFIPMYFSYLLIDNSYVEELKKGLVPSVINSLGDIHWLSETPSIADETLIKSHLFGEFNDRNCDDNFEGKYNGVSFKISESSLGYTSGKKDDRYVVFDGVIILIDSNKNAKSDTIVTTKGDKTARNSNYSLIYLYILALIPLLGMAIIFHDNILLVMVDVFFLVAGAIYIVRKCRPESEKSMLNMQLEDSDFTKKYDVYSKDQIEGRYLVTPAFMERFKNLHTSFGTEMAKCAFFDDKIMFALSTGKNLFELTGGMFFSLKENTEQAKIFYEEISAIYEIIDYFKLAEKTGL